MHPIDQLDKSNAIEWRKDFFKTLKDLVGEKEVIDPKKYTINYCLFEYEGKNYTKAATLEAERHYGITQPEHQ